MQLMRAHFTYDGVAKFGETNFYWERKTGCALCACRPSQKPILQEVIAYLKRGELHLGVDPAGWEKYMCPPSSGSTNVSGKTDTDGFCSHFCFVFP